MGKEGKRIIKALMARSGNEEIKGGRGFDKQ